MGLLLMAVVELSDGVEHSTDLLRFPSQEKIAGKHSDELFKIVLSALLKHDLGVRCE